MKRLILPILIVAALALSLGFSPEAGADTWAHLQVYDSLDISGLSTDADTLLITAGWTQSNPAGQVILFVKEDTITTSNVEATYNFKIKLRQSDGEYTWAQYPFFEDTASKTAAVDLLGQDEFFVHVMLPGTLFFPAVGSTLGPQIYMIITKNDCNRGEVSVWIWRNQY